MSQQEPFLEFLERVADEEHESRSEIRTLLPNLLSRLGFDDYSLESDVEGSIADALVLPHAEDAPVLAFQFGYNPEASEHGPFIPHRPSHVDYSPDEQILSRTGADFVISLSNTTLAVRSESYARTVVLQDSEQSLERIPTYAYLRKEIAEEIISTLHSLEPPSQVDKRQGSLSDF